MYGYMRGLRGSRKLERALHEDVGFRLLSGNQQPDFWTLAAFRRRHHEALGQLFEQTVRLAEQAGLLPLNAVATDGTKVRANASRHKAMSYGRMDSRMADLRRENEDYLAEVDRNDQAEDEEYGPDRRGDELPEHLRTKAGRIEAIRRAKAELEARARAKAEVEQDAYRNWASNRCVSRIGARKVSGVRNTNVNPGSAASNAGELARKGPSASSSGAMACGAPATAGWTAAAAGSEGPSGDTTCSGSRPCRETRACIRNHEQLSRCRASSGFLMNRLFQQ